MKQHIKKVASKDGTKIAYAKLGKGPPLVKTATYITHLEHDWENPIWRPFLKQLSRHHTLYRYDERGCGLSDWYTRDYSWETWVEDLKAVVDAEKLDKFVLFGQSQGSTVAVAFAARYPERVEKLIILAGYARGWLHRDLSETEKKEEQMMIDMMKIGWGKKNPAFRKFFCSQLMPGASAEKMNAFNQLMKISSEPEIAARLEKHMHLSNVVDEAPRVQCPTLVLHPADDASIPFKEGKLLAGLIPNARFVRLDSSNHILQEDEPAWRVFWEEVYGFLEVDAREDFASTTRREPVTRVLKTILFTDIVESTRLALELGDEVWIKMLEMHHELFVKTSKKYFGEIIKDTGDGFLLLFNTPTAAMDCAGELLQKLQEYKLSIRCGIHAGEVELVGGDVRGINVHIASRVLSQAGGNEIWTTNVVKELALGTSLQFQKMGEFKLKGIPDKKTLFKIG